MESQLTDRATVAPGRIDAPAPAPSDLVNITENLETFHTRLENVRHRLNNLYGEGDSQKPREFPGGVIPNMRVWLEELDASITGVERVVERL